MSALLQAEPAASIPAAREPAVRTAIGVLVTRFPRIDETFILREIDELERQGQPVLVIPLLRGRGKVIHEEARPWLRRALYLPLISAAIVWSNLRMLASRPWLMIRLLAQLIAGSIMRPSTLIRTLALFPKSVHLARILPSHGIRHVHSHFASHATTMAYIIASLSDITYSFTVHGPDIFAHRTLLYEKIAKAKFVRTISVFNKAFMCGLYPSVPERKIEVVRTGVNPDVYIRAAEEGKAKTGPPRILSVGALTPSRGFTFLVEACDRLVKQGVELDCTIIGEGSMRRATQRWIDRHGLTDRIHLAGALPQHEVAKLMGETDIFVLPSVIAADGQMDGIPVSLIEAMAAGKPVIAAGVSGIPELVQDGVNGMLVDATHTERIAEAMRVLIADAELRERMGQAGQAAIRSAFELRESARGLIGLLDRGAAPRDTPLRIRSLKWSDLGICALGIRHIHERRESLVTEVAITDGIRKRDVVVKQHRTGDIAAASARDLAEREIKIMSSVRELMPGGRDHSFAGVIYTVPRVLLSDVEHATLVIERARGRTLEAIIKEFRNRGVPRRLATPLRRSATWLALMQQRTRSGDDGRQLLASLTSWAKAQLQLAAAGDRVVRRHREKIMERIQELEARVITQPLPIVGHHGDYWPGNIFIDGGRVEAIDFEGFRQGLPLEDVAHFLIHLELYFAYPVFRRAMPKLARIFLDAYARIAGPIDADALRLFHITSALGYLARGQAFANGTKQTRQRRAVRGVLLRNL